MVPDSNVAATYSLHLATTEGEQETVVEETIRWIYQYITVNYETKLRRTSTATR
jgi:chromatin remodeling complex protein RSC6